MSIMDFIKLLKDKGITTPIHPLSFPASSPSESMILETGEGFSSRGSVIETTITVTVRAEHPNRAEELSQGVIDILDDLTNQQIGNKQAIVFKTQQILPQYIGKDEQNNHYFMNNFKVLISK